MARRIVPDPGPPVGPSDEWLHLWRGRLHRLGVGPEDVERIVEFLVRRRDTGYPKTGGGFTRPESLRDGG